MQRVILLGASNLTLGLPCVLNVLSSSLAKPVEVFAAIGHGRSYGIWSRILCRGLPGIADCGLWQALHTTASSSTRPMAVMTDIGNDLLYGVEVSRITEWVDICCQRLTEQNASITLTLLPMERVCRLSAWQYHIAKTLLFPGHHRIAWPEMRRRIDDLNEQMCMLGDRYGAHLFEPPGRWYGLDPIHIRRCDRPDAWRQILSLCVPDETTFGRCRPSLRFRIRCWTTHAAKRRVCGRPRTTRQPVFTTDGLTLSLY